MGPNEWIPQPPTHPKEFLNALDDFLKVLSVKKEEMSKNSRNWEALTAFLWALDTHYPKILRRLRYRQKARLLLADNFKLFDLGRLIKFRRIALANLGVFL